MLIKNVCLILLVMKIQVALPVQNYTSCKIIFVSHVQQDKTVLNVQLFILIGVCCVLKVFI